MKWADKEHQPSCSYVVLKAQTGSYGCKKAFLNTAGDWTLTWLIRDGKMRKVTTRCIAETGLNGT
jgi:hypothetical protein